MKHESKSASPCELACAIWPVRHAPTRQAKPTSHDHTGELCTFSSVGANVRRLTSFSSPGGEETDEGELSPCSFDRSCDSIALQFCSRMKNVEFPSQVLDFTLFLSFSFHSLRLFGHSGSEHKSFSLQPSVRCSSTHKEPLRIDNSFLHCATHCAPGSNASLCAFMHLTADHHSMKLQKAKNLPDENPQSAFRNIVRRFTTFHII